MQLLPCNLSCCRRLEAPAIRGNSGNSNRAWNERRIVGTPWSNRLLVKARPNCSDDELALRACVTDRLRMLDVLDRVSNMTVELTEVLFLATRQRAVVAEQRKAHQQYAVSNEDTNDAEQRITGPIPPRKEEQNTGRAELHYASDTAQ